MSDDERCKASANLRGEHIPCDKALPHDGWAHGNLAHGLIWRGAEPEFDFRRLAYRSSRPVQAEGSET